MSSLRLILVGLTLLLASCATTGTIAQLKGEKADLKDEVIEGGLDKAIQSYQLYLDQAPESDMTPETIRRLVDLKIKKEFDAPESGAVGEKAVLPAPGKAESPAAVETAKQPVPAIDASTKVKPPKPFDSARESIKDFEKRTTSGADTKSSPAIKEMQDGTMQSSATREAIAMYMKMLKDYPNYELNDQALYQLAHAYEESGNAEEAMKMLNRLTKEYPKSGYIGEVQFRRGEYLYAHKRYSDAKEAYKAIVDIGAGTAYYELALYKLGWSYYKLDLNEEAINQFVSLLDHKVASGYDLERPMDIVDQKRVEDTYRVMSLGFSNMGGVDAVAGYFNKHGRRIYETSVHKDLGDYYLEKRRYGDAAATFKAFVKNNPYHKLSPYFDMWAIDSYKKGGFPMLVIESNKEFLIKYGLKSEYWKRFDVAAFGEVFGFAKSNLKYLADYYHAQYQDKRFVKNKDENFQEAVKWYREFLNSYPKDEAAPAIRFQLAELLHENRMYGLAVTEYEHTAYDYPVHEKSAAAGYAAVHALRESLATTAQGEVERVKRDIVRSSLRFVEAFPKNEKTALVMSAAVDDIYGMKDYPLAADTSRKLLARYSSAERPIRRAAWLVFAHSSFELGAFKDAEEGYLTALGLTAENDPSRQGLIENLAASFYKQGEQANKRGDYRTAANYFLLVGSYAPTAKIRPVADFDVATALIQLKDWNAAANVARLFRVNYPGHALQLDLSNKLAFAYKEAGELSLAAEEYERIAAETLDAVVRRETLAEAGDLYYRAKNMGKAYPIYQRYVNEFPKPLEHALEMRNKIATYLKTLNNVNDYLSELQLIMEADANAGSERTSRTRYLGATAALEFAEITIKEFAEVRIAKPFDKNLIKKKDAMKAAKEQLERLFNYEMDELTSAATYYLAEMYHDFSRKLVESERPDDLSKLEKEQYELSIEEQAYPFEEKTIQVHQKNLELMARGIFNPWIEKSIEKLAKLVPARYAKFEISSGFIETVDNVNYAALTDLKPVISKASPVVVPPNPKPVPARGAPSSRKKAIDTEADKPAVPAK